MEEELWKFLETNILSYNEDKCKNCDRIVTAPNLQIEPSLGEDFTEDIEQPVHTIPVNEDPETIKYKDNYHKALLHKTLENETQMDEEKLEETKKSYEPVLEKVVNSTWDLPESQDNNNITKILYKDLSNLDIQSASEDKSVIEK